jgi:hypothetical protein
MYWFKINKNCKTINGKHLVEKLKKKLNIL